MVFQDSAGTVGEVSLYYRGYLRLAIGNILKGTLALLLVVVLVLSSLEVGSIDRYLLKAPPVALVALIIPAYELVAAIGMEHIAVAGLDDEICALVFECESLFRS